MKTKTLIVKAEKMPLPGIENPRANQIYKNSRLVMEERTLGTLDSNKIRIKVLYVGVCGSDVHLLRNNKETGYISTSVPVEIPEHGRIIGHEGVGQVLEVGTNVKHIEKDAYVTLESIVACNTCDVCKRGDFNQCRNAKLVGLEVDGIMGNIIDVEASLAHDITSFVKDEKDLIAMACVEPAGVAYVACENANITPGERVIVFGGGPIGAYVIMLCKLVFGASEIYAVEPVEFRRNLIKTWTKNVYSSIEKLKEEQIQADVIIESSGCMANVNEIINRVDANGRIVLLARSGEPLLVDAVDHIITNNISITGSRGHLCGAFNRLLRLHTQGIIELDSIVTSVADGLEELKEILETDKLEGGDCKVVVKIKH